MILHPSTPVPFQTKQTKNLPCGTGLDWDVFDQIWAGLPRVVFLFALVKVSGLSPASCSPHRNGNFSLTQTPDCKAAHLSSPLHGLLLLSPGPLWMWSEQLPSLSSSSLRSQALWDRAVAFLCLQRNIYGSNFYNLHLSLNILVFFPQGFQYYSCQKGCLISQMSFALLVSFIIFMLSIESTYILFPSDNLSSLQWADG